MIDLNDPSRIVPAAIPEGSYTVRPFEFAVRTVVDYDVNFLQDRLHSSIFVNGHPVGVFSVLRFGDDMAESPGEAIARYGPDLERSVVDEFMGLGYREKIAVLENQVHELQAYRDRPRWWQLRTPRRETGRFFTILRHRIANFFTILRHRIAKFVEPNA